MVHQSRLTGYDIAPGDRILFISFKGANSITLQPIWKTELLRLDKGGSKRNWVKREPALRNWIIDRLTICEVTSTIQSREEYCYRNKLGRNEQLWVVDPISKSSGYRDTWDRVFEFRKHFDYQVDARLVDIYDRGHGHVLVDQLANFLSQAGRNRFVLDINQYEYLLQKIIELSENMQ